MGYAFISYCRADIDYVRKLAAFLRGNGVDVWLDFHTPTGERWRHLVCRKIDECSAFVLVMSPAADQSSWVDEEIDRARIEGKPIMPLLLAGRPVFGLSGAQYVDVRDGTMPGAEFVDTLRGHTGSCDASAPTPNQTPAPAWPADDRGEARWRDALTDPWAFVTGASAGLALDGVVLAADRGARAAAAIAAVGAVLAFSAYVLAAVFTRR